MTKKYQELCLQCTERDLRTFAIIGAAMEVHQRLGRGFLEAVYQEALAIELGLCNVPFEREVELPSFYRSGRLQTYYRADFVCSNAIIVETKALTSLSGTEDAQSINYLRATGMEVGLLLNFGASSLEQNDSPTPETNLRNLRNLRMTKGSFYNAIGGKDLVRADRARRDRRAR